MVGVSAGEEQRPILLLAWGGWNLYRFSLWALAGVGVEIGEMDMRKYPTFGRRSSDHYPGGMAWIGHSMHYTMSPWSNIPFLLGSHSPDTLFLCCRAPNH